MSDILPHHVHHCFFYMIALVSSLPSVLVTGMIWKPGSFFASFGILQPGSSFPGSFILFTGIFGSSILFTALLWQHCSSVLITKIFWLFGSSVPVTDIFWQPGSSGCCMPGVKTAGTGK